MKWLSVALIAAITLASSAAADVPQMINYQGRLTDSTGETLPDGGYSLTFGIYPSEVGYTALWTEGQLVQIRDGLLSVMLGSINPIPAAVFAEPNRWLQITVGLEEVLPRTRFVTAPYAYQAERSDTAAYSESGTSGWVDDGSIVRLATETDTVGIGTTNPGEKLSVAGIVESTSGGFKFPDGSIQTTATSVGGIAIITGSAAHNDLITPPPGYTLAQCKCIVSSREFGPSGSSQEGWRHWCYVTQEAEGWRVYARSQNTHYGGFDNDIANYMVIGVK